MHSIAMRIRFAQPLRGKPVKLQSMIAVLFLLLSTAKGFLPQVDPSPWDAILCEYVNQEHLVDYAKLKQQDLKKLRGFVSSLGKQGTGPLSQAAKEALLINAYNAMTMEWIVENYPTKSIWDTPRPFQARRFQLAGEPVSLDEIETRLREMKDPRIHSALVCASLSCPPLRREAYVADRLDQQLDANVREWLADPSLNEFLPDQREVIVSPIFKWYAEDFEAYPGGLRGFLLKFGPPRATEELRKSNFEIHYMTYQWGLNDQSGGGKGYSTIQLGYNWLKNWFRDWFAALGRRYNVNPVIFGSIYVGAIPFFTLCVAWIVGNLRKRKSIVVPVLSASFFFISAYLYLLIVGRNIPAWVYAVIVAMICFGLYSTIRKIRAKAGLNNRT